MSGRGYTERKPPAEPPPLPLIWLRDIAAVLIAQDFVQGVLMLASAAVVYGDSNAGKTFWVTDLALHVAAGREWNGRRVDGGGVVYCVLEGGHGFRNRVAAWRDANLQPDERIPFAAIPAGLNLLDPDADVPRLIERIKAAGVEIGGPIRLVVVDTLSRALAGGDENSSDDMGALVRAMDAIRAATGACVLFIHHCGKDSAKGARGHSSLRAAIDTEIEVVAGDRGSRTATVAKQRDLPKGDSFGFKLKVVEIGRNQHDEPVTTCLVEPVEATTAREGKPLTEAQAGWLRDIIDMGAEPNAQKMEVPIVGMTAILTLTRDQVRAGFKARGRFQLEPDGNLTGGDREKLRSWLNTLRDKGKIGMTERLIWMT